MALIGDPSIWPNSDHVCAIDPCGQFAVMPGPMCFPHFKMMPRPHQRAIRHAIQTGTVDDQQRAVAAAVERVQQTVNMIRAEIHRVETGSV